MPIPDVIDLLAAFRRDADGHEPAREWLDRCREGGEIVGVSDVVCSAVVRLATNFRVCSPASTPDQVLDFCQVLRDPSAVITLRPEARHRVIFDRLCRTVQARANVVSDAYLAALALENGATLVTRDRGFARFPDLRLLDPFAG